MKKEVNPEPGSQPPPKKKWWGLEEESLAALGTSDDPEEFPGQHIFVGRSVDEDYKHLTLNDLDASLWSAMDHGENYVDLAGPSQPQPPPAPKEEIGRAHV